MNSITFKLGMIKELNPKYRIWYVLFLVAFFFFNFYFFSNLQKDDPYGIVIAIIMMPSVLIVSLPSLFPEKEMFQLFLKFTNSQIKYRTNYFKVAFIIDYSEITSIEIKPTKIIITTAGQTVEISFNTIGYNTTQEIKSKFEELKKEIEDA